MPSADELARDFLSVRGPQSHAIPMCLGTTPPPVVPLPCVVALGAFDGVHRGHLDLLGRAARDAAARGCPVLAVTFDPDPDEVVSAHPAPKLMSISDRVRALCAAGAGVAVVPFTRELAACDHVVFFEQVLAPYLDMRAIHVGVDFRLGAHGASTVEVLRSWGDERGVEVFGHALLGDGSAPITATRIRAHLAAGDVGTAARELGRRPCVHGIVTHGRGRGTGMGFPTANIEVAPGMQLPAAGVYAGFAQIGAQVWPAAVNVGAPPMFADFAKAAVLEANLIGYHGDLYGKMVGIAFERLLRQSRRFDSIDALIAAVDNDIATVRAHFGAAPVRIA